MLFRELAQAPRGISNAKIALGLATSAWLVRSLLVFGRWWRLELAGVGGWGMNSFLLTGGSHISELSFLIKDRKATVQKDTLKI